MVLDAELYALEQAARLALTREAPVTVYTDSQSALDAIQQAKDWPTYVRSIRENADLLQSQRRGCPITLKWVPAHVGNEKADQAAKKGTQGGRTCDRQTSLLYVEESITKIKKDQRTKMPPQLKHAPKSTLGRATTAKVRACSNRELPQKISAT